MPECQILSSLFLLSSNSKKTRSGFTTRSLLYQAGNVSFLSKLARVVLAELVRMAETKRLSAKPIKPATAKNLPLKWNFLSTKFLNT